jgi:hypothetical protein
MAHTKYLRLSIGGAVNRLATLIGGLIQKTARRVAGSTIKHHGQRLNHAQL